MMLPPFMKLPAIYQGKTAGTKLRGISWYPCFNFQKIIVFTFVSLSAYKTADDYWATIQPND